MRSLLVVALAVGGLVLGPLPRADAGPGVCPPFCDSIPDAAWIVPIDIPLYPVYRWPGLAGLAVTTTTPRFLFEELCASPPPAADPRDYAVAARADVVNPDGQWQLRTQIIHWRGDTAHGGSNALLTLQAAQQRLRDCQRTVPEASPSLTTAGEEDLAAVISVAGRLVAHQYLLAHPTSSTVVELALWSTLPLQVPWPAVADMQVLDAMAAPLCAAYLGSCR